VTVFLTRLIKGEIMNNMLKSAIDSIQYAKHSFLNATISEESFRKPLGDLVDAQSLFLRNIVNAQQSLYGAFVAFDYSKLTKKSS
jgi:hypothetical protein